MAEYNGHRNWNHWNVCLWIMNDEGLYNLARTCRRVCSRADLAAKMFINTIDTDTTPDGAKYTISAVRAAITHI